VSGRAARTALIVCAAVCAGVCALAGAAHAAKVFRWVDRNGVAHYGDHLPEHVDLADTTVSRIPVPAVSEPIARLTLEPSADRVHAWAENTLAGPIEVRLYQVSRHGKDASIHPSASRPLSADPPLPVRAVVPGQQRVIVSTLVADHDALLRMDVVPGTPNARPRDIEYLYPLQIGSVRVEQGYGGRYSHNDAQNRYAVDFAADIGTPVVAARAGTVMQVEGIVHDDGTMALYAHLKLDGVLVRVGQRVRKGQTIGLSGNTGYTSGPHLHFVVQVNRGMALESIPFRMFGPGGILRFTEPN
jgi:hypothetical protein